MWSLNESWYPYWAWEHFQYGFFEKDVTGKGARLCEIEIKSFFLEKGLFESVASHASKSWPVCFEHFLTGNKVNPVSFLGQVSSFFYCGVGSDFSYAYNQLSLADRRKNNGIAKQFINEWRRLRECRDYTSIYKRVEEERLRRGYTARVPQFLGVEGSSTFIQGDMFSDT